MAPWPLTCRAWWAASGLLERPRGESGGGWPASLPWAALHCPKVLPIRPKAPERWLQLDKPPALGPVSSGRGFGDWTGTRIIGECYSWDLSHFFRYLLVNSLSESSLACHFLPSVVARWLLGSLGTSKPCAVKFFLSLKRSRHIAE